MIGAIIAGGLSAPTAPVTNSWESIESFTVGSGGTSSITFGSGGTIPQTYKHLQIRAIWKGSSGIEPTIAYNSDTTLANYYRHYLQGDGSSASAGGASNRAIFGYNTGTNFTGNVMDILDYANVNKNKVSRTVWGNDTNGGGYIGLTSGLWLNTAAITSITIAASFSEYSSFALYGIKG